MRRKKDLNFISDESLWKKYISQKLLTNVTSGHNGSYKCPPKFVRVGATVTFKMEAVNAGHPMSLAALQRQDPYINKLLDVTGHVALYNFNSKANEWVSFSKDSKQLRGWLTKAC